VIFDAAQRGGGTRNLWRISISPKEGLLVGEPQKLTARTGEESPSVSRDGRIAFVNAAEDWDIWSLPIDANRAEVKGDPVRIVSGLSRDLYPSVSADGRKLVYTSDRAGNNDIWLRDLESGKDTPVTVGPANEGRGVISPDGTKVVFGRREQGQVKVYLAELGRGTERLLLENIGLHMDWTPDGKKILYYTTSPIRWKTVDVETGEQRTSDSNTRSTLSTACGSPRTRTGFHSNFRGPPAYRSSCRDWLAALPRTKANGFPLEQPMAGDKAGGRPTATRFTTSQARTNSFASGCRRWIPPQKGRRDRRERSNTFTDGYAWPTPPPSATA